MEDIFRTLVDTGDFRTLVRMVQAAGMEDMLSNEGPITFFAPTDEAFHRFPADQREALMDNEERLVRFLRGHIVEDLVRTVDLRRMRAVTNLNGDRLSIDVTNAVRIDNAYVTEPDIRCSNGAIQGIGEPIAIAVRLLA